MKSYYDEYNYTGMKNRQLWYGSSRGQSFGLRAMAIKELGVEKVAAMSDSAVDKHFSKAGLIPVGVYYENGHDSDTIFLIPVRELTKYERLER